ncbi:MAG: glycosyltransferase family 4 protein [Actinomycetota bacterium]|nr:glycosyltransferase family 4 protein [Actinomycetota bacterium]
MRLADTELFEVHVVTGVTPAGTPSHEEELRRELGPRLHVVPALSREINPVKDGRALVQLARLMRRERFDLVHTHMSKAGVLGRMAARAFSSALVVHTFHGWSLWDSSKPWVRNAVGIVERSAAKWSDMLFVVCDRDRVIAVEEIGLSAGQLADGHQGVPLGRRPGAAERAALRRRYRLPADGAVVGTITRLVPHKRVGDFVRAARHIQDAVPGTVFVIMGSGPEEPDLRALSSQLGVEHVVWLPTSAAVTEVLGTLDVFVHPSDREGLPMVVLQALSAGVPVVAQDAGGTREAVRPGETGVLVPVGDYRALADGVVLVLTEPHRGSQMARAGRRLIEDRYLELDRVRSLERDCLRLLQSVPRRGGRSGPASPGASDEVQLPVRGGSG